MPRSVQADVKTQEQPTALVAAALTISSSIPRRKYRKPEAWQSTGWEFYDTIGELRYAVSWFANALSRARLYAAKVDKDGHVIPVTTGPAAAAMTELLGSSDGQAAILKAMGQHFFVAGEWYLVGRGARPEDEGIGTADELWEIVSVEEMKNTGGKRWKIDYGNGDEIKLTDSDVIIRMWNPHPRRHTMPDSPVRSSLGDLQEISTLSRHIGAQVFSRLTGAGLLLVPSEMTFAKPVNMDMPTPEGADPFLMSLGQTMMTAINDPGDPAAFVPTMLKAPGEQLQYVKHITFWSELDEKALSMRDAAIRRFALGIDLPPEVLLGTADINHWGSWQIEESSIKAHIEPALEVICASLTTGYLRTASGDDDVVVAYDTSALRLRPNRSQEAIELWDRGVINDEALQRETGFEKDDQHDPESKRQWMLTKVASGSATPEMVAAALKLLGVDLGNIEGGKMREARPDPSLEDHPTRDIPERQQDRQAAALLSACDALAHRAMERAGNRLKNRTNARGLDPTEMHLHVAVDAKEAGRLLEGSWAPLAQMAERQGYDSSKVQTALDGYCRTLLIGQQPHEYERMSRVLTSALGLDGGSRGISA